MSRYFFDLVGGSDRRDVLGVELADDGAARQEAVMMAQANGHMLPTYGTGARSW